MSGPDSRAILESIFTPSTSRKQIENRKGHYGKVVDPQSKTVTGKMSGSRAGARQVSAPQPPIAQAAIRTPGQMYIGSTVPCSASANWISPQPTKVSASRSNPNSIHGVPAPPSLFLGGECSAGRGELDLDILVHEQLELLLFLWRVCQRCTIAIAILPFNSFSLSSNSCMLSYTPMS